jgi:hypothetical protein
VNEQVATEVVIGVAVLGLLIYRQVMPRRVSSSSLRLVLILAAIGLFETVQYLQHHHGGTTTVLALGGSLVLAAIFGAARSATTRVWLKNGEAWNQGNWITAVLWIAAVAAHLGYDYVVDAHKGMNGLGNATIVLYLAVSLGVQRLIVQQRAQRLGRPAGGDSLYGTGPVSGAGS